MPSTFLVPVWNELTSVRPPTASTNPVLRLYWANGDLTLWLKVAPGGDRVAFASEVMGRAGFTGSGTRLLRTPELGLAFGCLRLFGNQNVLDKIRTMEERLKAGQDALLMEDVVGDPYGNALDESKAGKQGVEAIKAEAGFHATVVSTATIQRDLAKLIAADLILGNFDRISYNPGYAKFHTGNFIYNAAKHRFLPIDNDTVAPSLQHIKPQGKGKNQQKPTPLDLYRTAIRGGVLLNPSKVFPAAEQGSMEELLGDNAHKAIEACLTRFFSNPGNVQEFLPVIAAAAQSIAPMVREEVRKLVKETKSPEGERESLFHLMKTYNNMEGMNYSVFKVKCRFADYVVNNNESTDEALEAAVDYGLYREWKLVLDETANRPYPAYAIPAALAHQLGATEKVGRAFGTLGTRVTSQFGFSKDAQSAAETELNAKAAAKEVKNAVRTPRQTVESLRQCYDRIKGYGNTDNRIVKAKVLVISALIAAEIDQLDQLFIDIIKQQTPVAKFYRKALAKRYAKFAALFQAFDMQIQALTGHESALNTQDKNLLGATVLQNMLQQCRGRWAMAQT